MEHVKRAPSEGKNDYLVLVMIAAIVAGGIGYVAGQANAPVIRHEERILPATEDWHGNVRRSYVGH